jgi:hypothetical protein
MSESTTGQLGLALAAAATSGAALAALWTTRSYQRPLTVDVSPVPGACSNRARVGIGQAAGPQPGRYESRLPAPLGAKVLGPRHQAPGRRRRRMRRRGGGGGGAWARAARGRRAAAVAGSSRRSPVGSQPRRPPPGRCAYCAVHASQPPPRASAARAAAVCARPPRGAHTCARARRAALARSSPEWPSLDPAPSPPSAPSRRQDLDADARGVLDCARSLQRAAGAPGVAPEHVREALEALGRVRGGGGGGAAGGDGNLTKEELEETMKKMLAVGGVGAGRGGEGA